MDAEPTPHLDERFSDPQADATPWQDTAAALEQAELYWLTTVRRDDRPHVTPLIGIAEGRYVYFCTGPDEQKARNLEHNANVAVTTGRNTWADGLDVIVEGVAERVTADDELRRLAAAYETKYGEAWRFGVANGAFTHSDGGVAHVFRIEPAKVMSFAKNPHAQTTYRW